MSNIAVVIGHSVVKQGYYSSVLNMSEFRFNQEVARRLKGVDLYYRNPHLPTISGIKNLNSQLDKKRYRIVLSLHFNAFNKSAQGVEALANHKNNYAKGVCAEFSEQISKRYQIKNRGVKLIHSKKDRGGTLILGQKNDVVILEPFFGDAKGAENFSIENYSQFLNEFIQCL